MGSEDPKDMPDLLLKLNDEEFSVRDAATHKLEEYPLEYATRFLVMAQTEKAPEVQMRLEVIARRIVVLQLVRKDDKWRTLMAETGLNTCYWVGRGELEGLRVIEVTAPASDKLNKNDLIVAVNRKGITFPISSWVKVDEEVELTVRRYKNPDGVEQGDTDFITLSIKIKAVERKRFDRRLDEQAEQRQEEIWRDWKKRFDAEHQAPEIPYGLPSKLQGVYPKGP